VTARLDSSLKHGLLDGAAAGLQTLVTHLGLHSAWPPSTGNEAVGGSPAYARKAATWSAAAADCRALSAAVTFDVPASFTVRAIGLWSAATAGTLRGGALAGSAATRAFGVAAADLAANDLQSEAHGLVANDQLLVWPTVGAALPEGLAEDTVYFVLSTGLGTDSLRVSLSQGGAVVDVTGAGDGDLQKLVPEAFAGQGQYQVTALQVCLPG
jgi:hypothetical protein